jgi:hypothetical protein
MTVEQGRNIPSHAKRSDGGKGPINIGSREYFKAMGD